MKILSCLFVLLLSTVSFAATQEEALDALQAANDAKTSMQTTQSAFNALPVLQKLNEAIAARNLLTDQADIDFANEQINLGNQDLVAGNQKVTNISSTITAGNNNHNFGSTAMDSYDWPAAIQYYTTAKLLYKFVDDTYAEASGDWQKAIIHYEAAVLIVENPM